MGPGCVAVEMLATSPMTSLLDWLSLDAFLTTFSDHITGQEVETQS